MKYEKPNNDIRKMELETQNDIYELHEKVFDIYKRIAKRHNSIPAESMEYYDKEMLYMEQQLEEFQSTIFRYLVMRIHCMYCRTDDMNEFALQTRNYDRKLPQYVCDSCATNEKLYLTYFDKEKQIHEIHEFSFCDDLNCDDCNALGSYALCDNNESLPVCLNCLNQLPNYTIIDKEIVLHAIESGYEFEYGIMTIDSCDSMLLD